MLQFDITTNADVFALEEPVTRAAKLTEPHEITIRLARNLRWDFLRESRLAAAIAAIAARHQLTICDWWDRWTQADIEEHFGTSLVGIAAVVHAVCITNITGEELPC